MLEGAQGDAGMSGSSNYVLLNIAGSAEQGSGFSGSGEPLPIGAAHSARSEPSMPYGPTTAQEVEIPFVAHRSAERAVGFSRSISGGFPSNGRSEAVALSTADT